METLKQNTEVRKGRLNNNEQGGCDHDVQPVYDEPGLQSPTTSTSTNSSRSHHSGGPNQLRSPALTAVTTTCETQTSPGHSPKHKRKHHHHHRHHNHNHHRHRHRSGSERGAKSSCSHRARQFPQQSLDDSAELQQSSSQRPPSGTVARSGSPSCESSLSPSSSFSSRTLPRKTFGLPPPSLSPGQQQPNQQSPSSQSQFGFKQQSQDIAAEVQKFFAANEARLKNQATDGNNGAAGEYVVSEQATTPVAPSNRGGGHRSGSKPKTKAAPPAPTTSATTDNGCIIEVSTSLEKELLAAAAPSPPLSNDDLGKKSGANAMFGGIRNKMSKNKLGEKQDGNKSAAAGRMTAGSSNDSQHPAEDKSHLQQSKCRHGSKNKSGKVDNQENDYPSRDGEGFRQHSSPVGPVGTPPPYFGRRLDYMTTSPGPSTGGTMPGFRQKPLPPLPGQENAWPPRQHHPVSSYGAPRSGRLNSAESGEESGSNRYLHRHQPSPLMAASVFGGEASRALEGKSEHGHGGMGSPLVPPGRSTTTTFYHHDSGTHNNNNTSFESCGSGGSFDKFGGRNVLTPGLPDNKPSSKFDPANKTHMSTFSSFSPAVPNISSAKRAEMGSPSSSGTQSLESTPNLSRKQTISRGDSPSLSNKPRHPTIEHFHNEPSINQYRGGTNENHGSFHPPAMNPCDCPNCSSGNVGNFGTMATNKKTCSSDCQHGSYDSNHQLQHFHTLGPGGIPPPQRSSSVRQPPQPPCSCCCSCGEVHAAVDGNRQRNASSSRSERNHDRHYTPGGGEDNGAQQQLHYHSSMLDSPSIHKKQHYNLRQAHITPISGSTRIWQQKPPTTPRSHPSQQPEAPFHDNPPSKMQPISSTSEKSPNGNISSATLSFNQPRTTALDLSGSDSGLIPGGGGTINSHDSGIRSCESMHGGRDEDSHDSSMDSPRLPHVGHNATDAAAYCSCCPNPDDLRSRGAPDNNVQYTHYPGHIHHQHYHSPMSSAPQDRRRTPALGVSGGQRRYQQQPLSLAQPYQKIAQHLTYSQAHQQFIIGDINDPACALPEMIESDDGSSGGEGSDHSGDEDENDDVLFADDDDSAVPRTPKGPPPVPKPRTFGMSHSTKEQQFQSEADSSRPGPPSRPQPFPVFSPTPPDARNEPTLDAVPHRDNGRHTVPSDHSRSSSAFEKTLSMSTNDSENSTTVASIGSAGTNGHRPQSMLYAAGQQQSPRDSDPDGGRQCGGGGGVRSRVTPPPQLKDLMSSAAAHLLPNSTATLNRVSKSSSGGGASISRSVSSLTKDVAPPASGIDAGAQMPFGDNNMESYALENLDRHTTGLLRKRQSIPSMLSWQRESIKKPLIVTTDKAVKKEAVDVFRRIQAYMGDRKVKVGLSLDALALEVCVKGWLTPPLRDEIYIQLCKQVTENPRPESLRRGWELLTICLTFFPPSAKFNSYLDSYVSRNNDNVLNNALYFQ